MNIPTDGLPAEKLQALLAAAQTTMASAFGPDSKAYLAGIKFFFKDQHGDSLSLGMGDDGFDSDEDDLVPEDGLHGCSNCGAICECI